MKYFVGIDIGGTKIAAVLADERGRILSASDFLINHRSSPKNSLDQLSQEIESLTQHKKISAIGIGTPGPVDPESGKIPWSPNLPGWKGINVRRILEKRFRVPICIENDANVAALAEMRFGAGRGKKDLIYVTVSTGIGGGIIFNGELYSGHNFNAGEVGHMTLSLRGPLCECGKHGCLEALASGTAIGKLASRLSGRKLVTSKDVKEAAGEGDKIAIRVLKEAGCWLGIGIGNLLNLLNPEVIVLGGGVMKGRDAGVKILWDSMIESTKRESWPGPFHGAKIVKTRFPDHVGALGAATLAMEKSTYTRP